MNVAAFIGGALVGYLGAICIACVAFAIAFGRRR